MARNENGQNNIQNQDYQNIQRLLNKIDGLLEFLTENVFNRIDRYIREGYTIANISHTENIYDTQQFNPQFFSSVEPDISFSISSVSSKNAIFTYILVGFIKKILGDNEGYGFEEFNQNNIIRIGNVIQSEVEKALTTIGIDTSDPIFKIPNYTLFTLSDKLYTNFFFTYRPVNELLEYINTPDFSDNTDIDISYIPDLPNVDSLNIDNIIIPTEISIVINKYKSHSSQYNIFNTITNTINPNINNVNNNEGSYHPNENIIHLNNQTGNLNNQGIYTINEDITNTNNNSSINAIQIGQAISNQNITIPPTIVYKQLYKIRAEWKYYLFIPNIFDEVYYLPYVPMKVIPVSSFSSPRTLLEILKYLLLYLIVKYFNRMEELLQFAELLVANPYVLEIARNSNPPPEFERVLDLIQRLKERYSFIKEIGGIIIRFIRIDERLTGDDITAIILGKYSSIDDNKKSLLQARFELLKNRVENSKIEIKKVLTNLIVEFYLCNVIDQRLFNVQHFQTDLPRNIFQDKGKCPKITYRIYENLADNLRLTIVNDMSVQPISNSLKIYEPNGNVYVYDNFGYRIYYIYLTNGNIIYVNERDLLNTLRRYENQVIKYAPLKGKINTNSELLRNRKSIRKQQSITISQSGQFTANNINIQSLINFILNNNYFDNVYIGLNQGRGRYSFNTNIAISYSIRERI